MSAYLDAISANRGAYFAGLGDVVIQVVESGTKIYSARGDMLQVDDQTVVRRSNHLFVTQRIWDLIMERVEVRKLD